jgi:holliday junction DNA helicase RuvA
MHWCFDKQTVMIEYIKGKVVTLTPASVVLENQGMGFMLHISVNTFASIQHMEECCLFVYESIREDAFQLYGFHRKEERDLFLLLIGVSGVGANTARMILSSLTVDELRQAIVNGQVAALQSVKGIGLKTAQRVIIDLKDKIQRSTTPSGLLPDSGINQQVRAEALAALQMLGFQLTPSQKVVDKLLAANAGMPVELLIKAALKQL